MFLVSSFDPEPTSFGTTPFISASGFGAGAVFFGGRFDRISGSHRRYGLAGYALPIDAGFSSDLSPACVNEQVVFIADNRDYPASSYVWNFVGGTPATATGPGPHVVQWSSPGNKTVTLTVNAFGCSKSSSQTITVNEYPVATANPSSTSLCSGERGVYVQIQSSASSFRWSPETGVSDPYSANVFLSPQKTTVYTCYVDNGSECETPVTVTVNIVNYQDELFNKWAFDNEVNAIAQGSNYLYVGGNFTKVSRATGFAAKLNASGVPQSYPQIVASNISGKINCAIPDGSDGFYLGGVFDMADGKGAVNLVHITSSGTVDASFVAPSAVAHYQSEVRALVLEGSHLYVGGKFTRGRHVLRLNKNTGALD
ncbi:MAG: hypothetical protein NZ534_12560, partial [Bacteroidia bacterium]|nr:hypothetical protein [Bacteroidia bacterium]